MKVKIAEVQQQLLAEIEGLIARIMPAIGRDGVGKHPGSKARDRICDRPRCRCHHSEQKRLMKDSGSIEEKIVAIEHRIYQSTDLFTDLLKPLIDELMVSHHSQLEKSVIQSIFTIVR